MVPLAATAALCLVATTVNAERITVTPKNSYKAVENKPSTGGSIMVAAGLHEINGKAAVCGLVWFEGSSGTTIQLEPKFTEKIRFAVDGKVLGVSSRAFIRYRSLAEAKAGQAGCSLSNRKWSDVKDPKSFEPVFSKRSTVNY